MHVIKSSIIVLIASAIMALIILCMDSIIESIMNLIYSLGK